jgi:coenzyme F420-0:L-glutamate ligase/coenzyme F420-1:gamma-L-glutamate ligase
LIQIIGLSTLPIIRQGDDIAELTLKAAREQKIDFLEHDIIVIAQKIVSRAEGNIVDLRLVTPSALAQEIAKQNGKDPRHVEAILKETARIIRMQGPHLIVETRHGLVCANAGVDKSNVDDEESVIVLPGDPDQSARRIRERFRDLSGIEVGVVISDTFGRPWRIGQVNVAIGVDGLTPIVDYRGSSDMFGRPLNVTQIALADELASAAELVMKKSDGIPVAIIRGLDYARGEGSARVLIRPAEEDLFR